MSSIDRADPAILGHVLAGHRDLFNLMQSVRASLAGARCPTPADCDALIESMRRLREHLREHFTQEEAGGFLEESVARMPRLCSSVKVILAEHPSLLEELDAAIDGLAAASPSATSWAAAAAAFERFATHMSDHERRENAVVQDGYNENLGLVE